MMSFTIPCAKCNEIDKIHKARNKFGPARFFIGLAVRAVPSTRVARAYSSSSSLLELNKARAFFELEYSIIFLQTPNSDKNWQTACPNVCHTITGQI